MDSGPVATFQVHEHLRPKVNLSTDFMLSNETLKPVEHKKLLHESRSHCFFFFFLQLCDLYENDAIFDKFECCLSGDGQRVATGSYRSIFSLHYGFIFSFR